MHRRICYPMVMHSSTPEIAAHGKPNESEGLGKANGYGHPHVFSGVHVCGPRKVHGYSGNFRALRGPRILDLTRATLFASKDSFCAIGMWCPSPNIAMGYLVSRHFLPDPPSKTADDYDAIGY